jgi:basic amino acid/polyamine antiporter, APA family
VFIFRRRLPGAERVSRVPLYPWTPLFFVATSAWFVAVTLVQRPAQAWAGVAFLALGVPVYFYWKRRRAADLATATITTGRP